MSDFADRAAAAQPKRRMPNELLLAGLLVAALGIAWRLLLGWERPLWVDETYTAAIATQASLSGLIDDCLHELGGPTYYGLMWLWAKVAPISNFGLRLPSALFSAAAPLLLLWRGHSDLRVRLLWACFAAVPYPALIYFNDARSYSLLFFLGCAQAILFARLLEEPKLGRAAAWSGISALLILTHYHAALLPAFQGAVYLAVHRGRALRTWPAALLFAPVAMWMAAHLPTLLTFANPQVAWQPTLDVHELLSLPHLLLGVGLLSWPIAIAVVLGLAVLVRRNRFDWSRYPYRLSDVLTCGTSILGILVIVAMGFVSPSFFPRYLIPYLPGVFLGLAVWSVDAGSRLRLAPVAVLAIYAASAASHLDQRLRGREREWWTGMSMERVAHDFMARDVREVAFFWDTPEARVSGPRLMERVAGFFYRRAGVAVAIRPLIVDARSTQADPAALLRSTLQRTAGPADGREGFVWMFARNDLGRSLQSRHPQAVPSLQQDFECRDYSEIEGFIILGCVRREA